MCGTFAARLRTRRQEPMRPPPISDPAFGRLQRIRVANVATRRIRVEHLGPGTSAPPFCSQTVPHELFRGARLAGQHNAFLRKSISTRSSSAACGLRPCAAGPCAAFFTVRAMEDKARENDRPKLYKRHEGSTYGRYGLVLHDRSLARALYHQSRRALNRD